MAQKTLVNISEFYRTSGATELEKTTELRSQQDLTAT